MFKFCIIFYKSFKQEYFKIKQFLFLTQSTNKAPKLFLHKICTIIQKNRKKLLFLECKLTQKPPNTIDF